jgi:hypothetical protein
VTKQDIIFSVALGTIIVSRVLILTAVSAGGFQIIGVCIVQDAEQLETDPATIHYQQK